MSEKPNTDSLPEGILQRPEFRRQAALAEERIRALRLRRAEAPGPLKPEVAENCSRVAFELRHLMRTSRGAVFPLEAARTQAAAAVHTLGKLQATAPGAE